MDDVARFSSRIIDAAAELRRRAEQLEPSFSTGRIIDDCFPGTLVTGGRLPPGVHEAVTRTPDGAVIVYERTLSIPDQRFAISHALAHLMWDGNRGRCTVGHGGDLFAEYRADEFAAELLAPIAMLAEYVGRLPSTDPDQQHLYEDQVDQIASRFVVPAYVIDQRIRLLIVDRRTELQKRLT